MIQMNKKSRFGINSYTLILNAHVQYHTTSYNNRVRNKDKFSLSNTDCKATTNTLCIVDANPHLACQSQFPHFCRQKTKQGNQLIIYTRN